jgi:hypothetical protein
MPHLLAVDETRIGASTRHKFIVCPVLHEPSVFQHGDGIGIPAQFQIIGRKHVG